MPTPLATPTPTPTAAPEPTKSPVPASTPVPPTPTSTPSPTKTPIPTATTVPAESPEPKCGENFILKDDYCICNRENFILRGGNCYPVCGTEAASPDRTCVCPDGYEKNDFGSCSKRCTVKHAHLSKFGECECDENFIKKNGKCICNEKDDELIGDKCLPKPGKHEKRVINGNVVNYICAPGYKHDKNNICQEDTKEPVDNPKKSSLFGGFFGGSQSNSTPTPTAIPEATLPPSTSNPVPTLEKQKKKEQPKQKPKVKKECYNIKNGDRIIQFDNGTTICQNLLLGKVRDCVEECPADKD